MTYALQLTMTKGGINRQRTEGSPSKDVLYDFVNGYRNQAMKAVVRPGSLIDWNLRAASDVGVPAGATKGFVMFRGVPTVFSHQPLDMPPGVNLEIVRHPTIDGMKLRRIHFANPFLQYLYVVAEFFNGDVWHYWLRSGDAWEANTVYRIGDIVIPTVPNGFVYQANRAGDPYPVWAANVPRTVGDRIEPTETDSNYYEVVETAGDNPRSGTVEPVWNTAEGALTYEDVDGQGATTPTPAPPTSTTNPGTGIRDRYSNSAGSNPGNRREQ